MNKAEITAKKLLTQLSKDKKKSKYIIAHEYRKYSIKPLYDWLRTLDPDEIVKFSYTPEPEQFIQLETVGTTAIFKDQLS